MRYLILASFLLYPCISMADEGPSLDINKPVSQSDSSWFSEIGVGLESGITLQEDALGRKFSIGWGLGPALMLGVFQHKFHRLYLGGGYLYYGRGRDRGTEQVEVKTRYHRIGLSAGYDFRWRTLVAGLHIGSAMMIVKTQTVFQRIEDYEVVDQDIIFTKKAVIDEKTVSGVDFGLLGGARVGIDLGRLFFRSANSRIRLELCVAGDYVRRGQRDDFFAKGMLVFWPLIKKSS
ncbi:MAG: hypothetical protein GY847_05430 [Proteobacteria bacterium]|nr:hypothetical protein [Pseudomonadota bacterium]